MALMGAYYNVNNEINVFARADLVNKFVSVGGTYKHKDFTASDEIFYGLKGENAKNGEEISHPSCFGMPVWYRVGLDMPLGANTSINWKGSVGNTLGSTLSLNQKINKNIDVGFVNDYQTNKDVRIGITFNYTV